MPVPPFDPQTGYLPAGLHQATEAEVGRAFGQLNHQRQRLFNCLQELLLSARVIRARRLFVDGSFVTDKERLSARPPQDIDCVIWLPENIDRLIEAADRHTMFLFGLHHTGKRGPLDLYPVLDQSEWEGWCRFFGSDREGVPKGCVEVSL